MDQEHKPFVSPLESPPEFTLLPIISGIVLGIIFGASSLYLALKVGMTVSASIPIAVLSITLFKSLSNVFGFRKATILENNIVQTTGSAGESIAFGVAITMPALMMLGYDMEVSRTMIVATLGGLLGILMMIPLRYALIVKGHKELAFPEGTACAEVLIVGEKGGIGAKTVFTGFFVGLVYKLFNLGFRLWSDTVEKALGWFKGATLGIEVSPELLGVGYIIGPRIACITFAGGILSSLVLTPMIKLFGEGLLTPLFPATKPISAMSTHEIWKSYVLYIGAGAVAAGGIISLLRSLPVIVHGAKAGLSGLAEASNRLTSQLRTERDIPMRYVLLGMALLILAIWFTPTLQLNLLGAILIIVFGFLFVTVSSRLCGEIGSSSNPISGMTVATLLVTSLIFLALGWVSPYDRVTALSIAAVVCVAASNGGTTSQDLKTGYLVGGTPYFQQLGILIGAFTSAIAIGFTLNLLNDASTIYSTKAVPAGVRIDNVSKLTEMAQVQDSTFNDSNNYHVFRLLEAGSGPVAKLQPGKYLVDDSGYVRYLVDPGINGALKAKDDGTTVQKYEAPKARLMSLIIDGILTQKLPWALVLLGVGIVLVLEFCGVPSLAFAVGVYLPVSTTSPIFVGGIIRYFANKLLAKKGGLATSIKEAESGPGVLYSSGLIAGGSLCSIAIAFVIANSTLNEKLNWGPMIPWLSENPLTSVVLFTIMALSLFFVAKKPQKAV